MTSALVPARPRRRRRSGLWLAVLVAVVVLVLAGAVIGAALLAWPTPTLGASDSSLAGVELPGFAGSVVAVDVRSPDGRGVPVRLHDGGIWPRHDLAGAERLTVVLTVRRPAWAAWLVGRTERRTLMIETPEAHPLGRWLQVKAGRPVRIGFDAPVSRVRLGHERVRRLARASAVVPVGVVAIGSHSAGTVEVEAAARSWEKLTAPVRVSWFPARRATQLLVEPRTGSVLPIERRLTLTFSRPVKDVLGSSRPRLTPATPGGWRLLDARTLAFAPGGFGFGLGATVRVELPHPVLLAGQRRGTLARRLEWHVPGGSTLRLHQLLAQLGYLPVDWRPAASNPDIPRTLEAQLSAATAPPRGRFSWRFPNTPRELQRLWSPDRWNEITRGAVMMFESTHNLDVDGFAGPHVWRKLLIDAVNGKRREDGYSYVFVRQRVPQSLNLWHNGRVLVSSPGNTGIAAAPTQPGTFPVYEHIPVGTMSGTNPDGSHYHDPGIRYISYFNGGDAIHAFNRASFGTPQSLGCVELPLPAAARVWPYTPIGTLVTIAD